MKYLLMGAATVALLSGCGKANEPSPPAAPIAVVPPAPKGPSWELVHSKDDMTDETRVSAQLIGGEARDNTTLTIRCVEKRLEALSTFDQYLGNDSRPVKFRIDQQLPEQESWSISAKGTAVFATESADFARQLMPAKKVLIEVSDYRGVTHRAMYEWVAGTEKIGEVLRACGRSTESLTSKVPGLRKDIALEIERWGPKNIEVKKRALATIAGFKGDINPDMTSDFALAVQSFADDFNTRCKAGKAKGDYCNTVRVLARAKIDNFPLWVGGAIYDQSPKAMQKEFDDLKISD
jgi:hypothetical protein